MQNAWCSCVAYASQRISEERRNGSEDPKIQDVRSVSVLPVRASVVCVGLVLLVTQLRKIPQREKQVDTGVSVRDPTTLG